MSSKFCVECGSSLANGDRFCTSCGAPTTDPDVEAGAESEGLTEHSVADVDWPPDPQQIRAPRKRRRTGLLATIGALGALVGVGMAVWFFALRPDTVSAAQQEEQTVTGLLTSIGSASSLSEVAQYAVTAQQRSEDLKGRAYTDSEDDKKLQTLAAVYTSLGSLEDLSATNPTKWSDNQEQISSAINLALAYPEGPLVDPAAAQAMVINVDDLAATAENHIRKQATLDEVQGIAYEYKRKRDALNPYFSRSSTGSDMYFALESVPAEWQDMVARLDALDSSGAPAVAAAAEDLSTAMDRGRGGIEEFLNQVPVSDSCKYKCWYSAWASSAGRYSQQNDEFMKHFLSKQLPRLQKKLRRDTPR